MRLTVSRDIINNNSYGCNGVDVMVYLETIGYVLLIPSRIETYYSIEASIKRLRSLR